ncbi:uncharacterized protein J8A68_005190 [[Candida] subhashii]|uniref:Uncharacterized protein n=1 Tax=[Candida] subhashii TaxID=561895 RepID=A0A8J5QI76_9ASCO|nr:uncharacterized protein J8A68_005190 [[Candida] subhashii]KAG7661298.1 hypothetical protein J8A68_005190 [[Candida] subhashii]
MMSTSYYIRPMNQQPPQKKQKTSKQLIYLPDDIGELIVSYVPDHYLETTIFLPVIGEFIAMKLYRYIEIDSPSSNFTEQSQFQFIVNRVKVSQGVFDKGSSRTCYKKLSVNQFVQASKTYPEILRKLPRINVSLRDDPNRASSLLELPYNIHSISDIPKESAVVKLLSSISGLCTGQLPQIADKSWGKDLQELELRGENGLDELPHLFPNLKKLRLGKLDLVGIRTPRLPSKLQCLSIEGYAEELDVTYLDNLTEFIVDIDDDLNILDIIKLPLGIERVTVFRNYFGPAKEEPANLEIYPNLKDIRLDYTYEPSRRDEPWVVSVTLEELLKIPDTLKTLTINLFNGVLLPDNLILPPSLRVLSTSSIPVIFSREPGMDWSSAIFPETLTELTLEINYLEGIELPISLQSLYLRTTFPIESVNFLYLKHLVNLKLSVIEASNLKQVEFTDLPFGCIRTSNFQLPDCVESLSFLGCLEPKVSEMAQYFGSRHEKLDLSGNSIDQLDKLPSSLTWLCLNGNPICNFSTPTFFSDLTQLRELRMASTKINEYFESDQSMVLNFPSSLVILNLFNNMLRPGVAPRLILSGCTQLQELWLSANPNMRDVQVIIDTIKSSSPEIVELRLDEEVRKYVKEEGTNFLWFLECPRCPYWSYENEWFLSTC